MSDFFDLLKSTEGTPKYLLYLIGLVFIVVVVFRKPIRTKVKQLRENGYRTLIYGIAFSFVGIALLAHIEPKTTFGKVIIAGFTEIGFALVIAWGIGTFIERVARKDYNEYIQKKENILNRNLFAYLYDTNTSSTVFEFVTKYLFETPIIKTKQVLEYELMAPEAESDWVLMKVRFDFTLKNISLDKVDHVVRFHASKVSGLDSPKDDRDGLKSINLDGVNIDPSEFSKFDEAAPDDVGRQKFAFACPLEPDQEVRVMLSFMQYKRKVDNDLFQSNLICEETEFTLRYNPEHYDIFVEPVHPSDKFSQEFLENENHVTNCRRVIFNEPLLPKNGVFFWWNPKATVLPNSSDNEIKA